MTDRLSRFQWVKQRALLNSGLLSGLMLFSSSMIVNIGSYVYNLIVGRWLGPTAFADVSLMVTLLMVATFVTSTLATVTSKFTAVYVVEGERARLAGLRRWLGQRAWALGAVLAILLTLGAPLLADFFHTQSAWPFVILGIGMPIFLAQSVDRGVLQGETRFGLLALSQQAEMWGRLIGGTLFIALGLSINGAVGALTLSFVTAWLVAVRAGRGLPAPSGFGKTEQAALLHFSGPVVISLLGQIVINNSDILIVKRFFAPHEAGQYAALALIGRVVFFATWSVVTMMFPLVAQRHQKGEPHRALLGLSLLIVAGISALITGATLLIPEFIVRVLFGVEYLSIAPLLWLYALATALYALANVIITYRLSLGVGGGSLFALAAGAAQVVGLWVFHEHLADVVLIQVYIMVGLFAVLCLWDVWLWRTTPRPFRAARRDETKKQSG